MATQQDFNFMARALQLARKGCYTTDPNPKVGCVLVKDGKVIAEGWHAQSGCAHAEIEALQQTNDARGAIAYVTLEPCSHHGRTPPCCDALIKAGIDRVVVAMQDPNPVVSGRGLERMRAAGIKVEAGIMETDARALNRGFIKRMTTGMPYVISKMAMSLDGRTAMASGESKWITSASSRLDVHHLRAASSAVLTGINTVLADDPSLNARLENIDVLQPARVILDSNLTMQVNAAMATMPGRSLILTCSDDKEKWQNLEEKGFEVFRLPEDSNHRVELKTAIAFLGQQEFNQVMIEAGPVLNGAFMMESLVDEWVVYMAPSILGDGGRGLFRLPGLDAMDEKFNVKMMDVRQIGPDLRLTFTA